MTASARIFACFIDWCARGQLDPSKYRITITPLTPDAEAKLRDRWIGEWRGVLRNQSDSYVPSDFSEGHIMAVPFKIEDFKG